MTELEPSRRLPAACDLYDRGISLGGVSKTLGLPGLRIGWVASRADIEEAHAAAGSEPRSLQTRLRELKDYTTICCSAPSEVHDEHEEGGLEGRIYSKAYRITPYLKCVPTCVRVRRVKTPAVRTTCAFVCPISNHVPELSSGTARCVKPLLRLIFCNPCMC